MRRLTVAYIGRPTEDAPCGDEFVATYDYVIGYHFDPDEKTLVIEHYRDAHGNGHRTVTYPESKVIRTTFQQDAVA
jgi:hypothetical protein